MTSVLILGAREGSLGKAIYDRLTVVPGNYVVTAGISGDEHYTLNESLITDTVPAWDHIICTIGINSVNLQESLRVNCEVPIRYLDAWLMARKAYNTKTIGSFIGISSNSAHIARSNSLGYCASKAALSMALRCYARDVAKNRATWRNSYIYGYEPCWVDDTPMSQEVKERIGSDSYGHPRPLHRVPGGHAHAKAALADLIAANLSHAANLHGAMLRVDLGEQ